MLSINTFALRLILLSLSLTSTFANLIDAELSSTSATNTSTINELNNLQTAQDGNNVPSGLESSKSDGSENNLAPIVAYGNKFFNSEDGKQFFIKGIAYQPSKAAGDIIAMDTGNVKFIDPLAEPEICLRDLPYLQKLGVNTVRVYSIDTDKDHDVCFEAFARAGIYVISDLSEPDVSVVRNSPTWDTTILDRYTRVVDALHKYPNLLGFFAGNEVTNDRTNTFASPFVKSSIRDVKEYIKSKDYRKIPVGYSTNDDAETRANVADFFACGDVTADFYGINMYEWCGHSTYWASGYKERTEEFKNYPVPIFFSEFGCNTNRPRPFTEVEALYSRLMTPVWSGGIAYMYFEEPNQYGVVKISNGEVEELEDFSYLEKQFKDADPQGALLDEYKAVFKASKSPNCPSSSKFWEASADLPHSPDNSKCDCMESSLHCGLSSYVKTNNLTSIFDYACNMVDCEAIKGDGKSGSYGFFSDCSARQKASYVINEVFLSIGGKPNQCDFDGVATLNSRVSSQQELESVITLSGDSCLSIIKANDAKKMQLKSKVVNGAPGSYRNSTASSSGNRTIGGHESSGSQIKFYENMNLIILISSIWLIALLCLDF